jgi:glycosyltransferase involved in cell wall biosynthesis
MRLTVYSNAPWIRSGYGTQTAQLTRRLRDAGHEVAIASNFGLMGTHTEWEGIRVFPAGRDKYSNDVAPGHHRLWAGQSGWLITLYDVWGLEPSYWKDARVASWTPVDHYPVPPAVASWGRDHLTLAWSKFAVAAYAELGIEARYVPLAIDLREYGPRDALLRGDSARTILGVPDDAFLVTIAAANVGNHPPRKGWGEMLQAFSAFSLTHPDAYLYLHTDRYGAWQGIDLPTLVEAVKIDPQRVIWADQYALLNGLIPNEDMAAIYTASDVLLATAYGEGFGLPVIEAQAAGCPVIVTDWTAQPELVGAGWIVPGQPWWDAPLASFYAIPIIGHIIEALEQAYLGKGDPQTRERAMAKAAEYDADKVFAENWAPVLAEMEAQLTPPNRATRRRKK